MTTRLEKIVRTFQAKETLSRIAGPIHPYTEEIAPADYPSITCGKEQKFEISVSGDADGNTTFTTSGSRYASGYTVQPGTLDPFWPRTEPPVDENPPAEQVINRLYTEVSRKTTRKRIENPDDASQYVEVERIDEITFSGPSENGASVNVTFKFNWVN